MYKEFQLSLYDFFGYFFPGMIFIGPTVYMYWPGGQKLIAESPKTAVFWTAFVLFSYLTGHFLQGLSNVIFDFKYGMKYFRVGEKDIPVEIYNKIRDKVATNLELNPEMLTDKWLYRICDQASGQDGLREIYVYREGFYRGMSVSSGILAALLFLNLLAVLAVMPSLDASFLMNVAGYASGGFFAIIASIIFYRRYERFRGYRINHALLGFLVQKKKKESEKDSG